MGNRTSTSRKREAARGSAGLSILEVLIGVAVFGTAMGAMVSSLVASGSLVETNRQTAAAMDVARSVVAELRSLPLEEVYLRYNDVQADDPPTGASPGSAFDVEGLEPRPGDPDNRVGLVVFPGGSLELREDAVDARLGTPRDLDLDGEIDDQDHATSYLVLPVAVRVDWGGASGRGHVELVTTLSGL